MAKAMVAIGDDMVAIGGLRAMLLRTSRGIDEGRVSLKQAARAARCEKEKEIILRALTRTRWNRRPCGAGLADRLQGSFYKLKQIGCSEDEAS